MNNLNRKIYKIVIIAPVPFYYHAPLYRKLSRSKEVDLTVFYCSNETLEGKEVEKTYNTKGKITNPNYLLDGYKCNFFKNYSPVPSFLNWPFGLINPGVFKEIKRGKYDAIVLQSWTNLTWWMAFFACMLFKTKIFFMTDSDILSETSKKTFKLWLKRKILKDFVFKKASGFLTSGTANEDFYRFYGVPREKIARVPFSWGYEELIKASEKFITLRDKMRELMNVLKDDFVILYVGRLAKEKRPMDILDVARKINMDEKKIFIVGDGPMRSQIEEYIKKFNLKNVTIVGFKPHNEIAKFYATADVLVLPSEHETWGIVVNEAMCFNLPVIVSDRIGAGVDLVKDGYNGFIFTYGNIEKISFLIEKMANLPDNEKKLFGQRSKEAIEQWISDIDPVKQILKLLEK